MAFTGVIVLVVVEVFITGFEFAEELDSIFSLIIMGAFVLFALLLLLVELFTVDLLACCSC